MDISPPACSVVDSAAVPRYRVPLVNRLPGRLPYVTSRLPSCMPIPFSSEDLGRLFESRVVTRGRSLGLIGAVQVGLAGDTIKGVVEDKGARYTASIIPSQGPQRIGFDMHCSCQQSSCVHLAAVGLAALDRFPELRRAGQASLLDRLGDAAPLPERQRLVVELSAGKPPQACYIGFLLVGDRSGQEAPATPRQILADATRNAEARKLAKLLGGGDAHRVGLTPAQVPQAMALLERCGIARWQATGRRLIAGTERVFEPNSPPRLPPKSAVILSDTGPWYVDGATGAIGRARIRRARPAAPAPRPAAKQPARRPAMAPVSEQVIIEQPPTPVLRLGRMQCPDEQGRLQTVDAMSVVFEYGGPPTGAGVLVGLDDDRQFLRIEGPAGPTFVRRDRDAENAAMETLRQDGFLQMRVADRTAKGSRVLLFRGRDAGESWQRFMADRMPELEAQGWRNQIEKDFGPRYVERIGGYDMQVGDAGGGELSVEFGIEVDGVRVPLLPILSHLLERGGIEAARIVDGEVITSLEDGRIVRLPEERIRRLLGIMGDLIESAQRTSADQLVLPQGEVAAVVELEELLAARWDNAGALKAYADRFRGEPVIAPVTLPASFTASLRHYQEHGVAWLQHLRAHDLSGFLADDMGLGKTAQTIAHIAVEHASGRMDRPALIVVPTSLVPNWTAELGKFAPALRLLVLHGMDRHERRGQIGAVDVVITTYTVLARDIEEMRGLRWHMIVLDEAQAIKSPDAKATRAVCQLEARHRICLSGTPIENNLEELWSQFAFLMPGLLGPRRDFARRFRTPIEKKGDDMRRGQLVRRIRPFLLRRTKAEVAAELPAKHTILRRITLAPDQRELYETIRATLHERVREQIAARSLAQSRIVVLDALLKLRQACCDPRLVKLTSARTVESSSKLDDLQEMITEMVPEGRRILVFSQFTSMLDLIAPRLREAGIGFVELRGDTRDRAEPVRAFEAGEVPVFLISLKAGGRGLNLTSADTVIHYDPWWNPAVEDQASDRAHRIGQTRSVFVFKLIAADTVEERILELQDRKAALANIAFNAESDVSSLGFDDIDYLFRADIKQEAA
jgi:superfamily II DNA or RNA helicase